MWRFILVVLFFWALPVKANWEQVNSADYTWGPFKIYNITLFSETGEYHRDLRPLMLTLKYAKPVEGRDFAISLARSWANLGIDFPEKESLIDNLRKTFPDIKPNDTISYIALDDIGYFIFNDMILPETFEKHVSDAMLSIWLDPKVSMSRALTEKSKKTETTQVAQPSPTVSVVNSDTPSDEVLQQHSDEKTPNAPALPDSNIQDKPTEPAPVTPPVEFDPQNPEEEIKPISDPKKIEPVT